MPPRRPRLPAPPSSAARTTTVALPPDGAIAIGETFHPRPMTRTRFSPHTRGASMRSGTSASPKVPERSRLASRRRLAAALARRPAPTRRALLARLAALGGAGGFLDAVDQLLRQLRRSLLGSRHDLLRL